MTKYWFATCLLDGAIFDFKHPARPGFFKGSAHMGSATFHTVMGKHVFTFIRHIAAHIYTTQYLFIYFWISHGHGGFSHGQIARVKGLKNMC